jgi:hypothetical protein
LELVSLFEYIAVIERREVEEEVGKF